MSDFSASNLYCLEDADESSYWDSAADGWDITSSSIRPIDSSPESDHRLISTFLESEIHHMPTPDYIGRFHDHSLDITSRRNAVNWILKVHEHYRFRPATACLSVNYLDRFLSSHSLPRGNGWPFQLLSVACLSLAAKMEETCVPVFLDFQLFEPRFVFELRTIRRMELLVMANLNWRMRAVTPFDFVDCFAQKLAIFSSGTSLFTRASDLILNTLSAIDFLDYRPSTIAASAVLCAARETPDISVRYERNVALLCGLLSKEAQDMVIRCQQLMEELESDTCRSAQPVHSAQSPVAVLDAAACGISDPQKSVSEEATRAESNKRRKLSDCEYG